MTVTFLDGTQARGTVSSVNYDATANLTTVMLSSSVFGAAVPAGVSVASPTSGAVTAYDNAIPGLENGFLYYIVVIDGTHIRLTLSTAAANSAAPITLTPPQLISPQTYGNSTISLAGFQDGINVTANLNAANTINAGATMGGSEYTWNTAGLLNGLSNTEEVVQPLLSKLSDLGVGALAKLKGVSSLSSAVQSPDESSSGFAGSLGVNYAYHDVEVTVGPAAVLTSDMDINVSSSITELSQTETSSSVTTPAEANGTTKSTAAVAVAIAIGSFTNIDKTTVEGTGSSGAAIDANGTVTVGANVSYPFLLANPVSAFDPAEYLKSSGLDGYTAAQDGTLGIGFDLFNTEVLTSGNSAKVGAGGSFALNFYHNTSTADVQKNVKINQNTSRRFRSGSQSVAVQAQTAMQTIGVVGVARSSLNLAGGIKSATDLRSAFGGSGSIVTGVQDIINPFGASGNEGGIGASLLTESETNDTEASVDADAQVYAGSTTDTFDPTAAGTISGNSIHFASAPGLATGTPVIYESDPNGKPIGGLINGKTYYVIANTGAPGQLAVNATDPTYLQLAATEADALNDVPITLDGSVAAGTNHDLVAGGLTVSATTPDFMFDMGQAGGSGSSLGFGGALTVGVVNNTTLAHIDAQALIHTIGPLAVLANDDLERIGLTGGVVASANIGVGISLGFNVISRNTQAYIGAGYGVADNSAGTGGVTAGAIAVAADSTGDVWTVSLAGAFSKESTEQSFDDKLAISSKNAAVRGWLGYSIGDPRLQENILGIGNDPNAPQAGVSVAGDVSINDINEDNAYAFINDAGTITDTGELSVAAVTNTSEWSLAGAVSIALKNAQTKANAKSTGVAGSISVNNLEGDAEAFIDGATVVADSVTVAAYRSGGIRSLTAGAAGSNLSASTSVAFSVSVNVVSYTVQAYVEAAHVTSTNDVSVTANDSTNIYAIAGAARMAAPTATASRWRSTSWGFRPNPPSTRRRRPHSRGPTSTVPAS